MSRHIQPGVRRRTASPRRLTLRLAVFDLGKDFFKRLADSFDDPPEHEQTLRATQTFDLPLDDQKQETTGGESLDADSIRSLRSMFLLLDDWDHKLREKETAENSSPKCEVLVDTKTQ
ncbi:MAG: hypothetical protein ACLP3K_11815 [Candidatus Acidiferrales bacterium]